MMRPFYHTPVLLREAVDSLNCRTGGVYLDGTLGGGGHAFEILKRIVPDGMLVGIDRDADAIFETQKKLASFGSRLITVKENYAEIKRVLANLNIHAVDGILLDLGVSSHQLDVAERGFSFSLDAQLDMRMDQSSGRTAYDLVNGSSMDELDQIIREYGEEMSARRIAKAIVTQREKGSIRTTGDLARLIARALSSKTKKKRIHPATKTFQALRIAVNDELTGLHKALSDGVDVLREGGRISVISFHSLEDRIVKDFFRSMEKGCICPADFPVCVCKREKKLRILTKRPVIPAEKEQQANPRARSAKLRTAVRI